MSTEHTFELVIAGLDRDDLDTVDQLYEAGLDDALVGWVHGVAVATVDREAPDILDAVLTAIRQVESVNGLRVTRVEDDQLVTLAEIAERTGRTRETVRQWSEGIIREGFPPPALRAEARSKLWRWADVAAWLGDEDAAADARVIGAVNAALELRGAREALDPDAFAAVRELLTATPEGRPSRT